MARSVLFVVAGCAAVAAVLSGCIFPYDAPKPVVMYQNDSDQAVTVSIEGSNVASKTPVSSHGANDEVVSECVGTALRVESEDGVLIGSFRKPACPGWLLTINKDGTLDYAKK